MEGAGPANQTSALLRCATCTAASCVQAALVMSEGGIMRLHSSAETNRRDVRAPNAPTDWDIGRVLTRDMIRSHGNLTPITGNTAAAQLARRRKRRATARALLYISTVHMYTLYGTAGRRRSSSLLVSSPKIGWPNKHDLRSNIYGCVVSCLLTAWQLSSATHVRYRSRCRQMSPGRIKWGLSVLVSRTNITVSLLAGIHVSSLCSTPS